MRVDTPFNIAVADYSFEDEKDGIMAKKPLLHLVFGGRVKDPQQLEFEDLDEIDIVGIFPDFKSAEQAWRGASQARVDDALYRYVVVHLHRLIDPEAAD